MENIFDYIDKNGNITFQEKEFNILDALTLSGIAYLPFCEAEDRCNIRLDILKDMISSFLNNDNLIKRCIYPDRDTEFAKKLLDSKRYAELRVFEYVEKISERKEEQFSALSFLLDDGNVFVSFSGTDINLIGWKENLNMSFTLETSGQKSAAEYVEKIAYKFPTSKLFLGGHSKGGNFAMYAGSFVPENIQNRIVQIFNFDGPGFLEETIEKEGYRRIRPKIKTIIPHSSIVGMILEQSDTYTAIYSKGIGIIEQHSFYNWKIKDDDFLEAKEVSKMSMASHFALRGLLKDMSIEEREKFVDIVAKLALATKMKTTKQVLTHVTSCVKDIISEYRSLGKDEKKLIRRTFTSLGIEFFKGTRRREDD